ncbi:flavin-containing monooxygenase 5-like isoform X1 [Latimeria chalumnae]|nr:PREDICTED: dimethylaniline monooxygenase [N-oxide-forming] 5-like isoform X1 [Latimeria chalumnae]|eukprot:XP_005998575.1 PREDICTED: dimethylaniline monooxygenase [N-oxide-forming] 5-like isoform X1 [Latimeria chalumnae]
MQEKKMTKRVAIIGAGATGLSSIKCCLDEGLEPTCFEKSNDIGGLWNFKETPEPGRASIYRSVIINTSKEMMCFSDFPIPEDYPNYMHNSKIMAYFRSYTKHFDLLKYIRFKTAVCSVKKRSDFLTTGQWDVVTTNHEGKEETAIFDGILTCIGHHCNPHMPLDCFPGIEKFGGNYFHSRDYKDPFEFKGKRVIVIGIGNSGGDIAVETSHYAAQVFLSTRRGSWVINRVGNYGIPGDLTFNSRFVAFLKYIFPLSFMSWKGEQRLSRRFCHVTYGLQPEHRLFSQHPMINDDLPNRIISGTILVKTNVKEFTETGAIFEDGTVEDNIDTVIFATGYSFCFPFLDESVIKVTNNHISLYKYVFPPQLEKPTLAIIGLVQPLGAIMPIAELQTRWVTRVFKGLVKLPSTSSMLTNIAEKKKDMGKRYVSSQRHTVQVDYVEYMDEIAKLVGVKPNLLTLFLTDPKLTYHVFFGPCTPYQYRLTGPGKWEKAREAILTQMDRAIKPLKSRVLKKKDQKSSLPMLLKVLGYSILLVSVTLKFIVPALNY